MRRPTTHDGFLALAQALAESGYQYDVVYCGDGAFNDDSIDPGSLRRYRTILVPEARHLGPGAHAALATYARDGGELVTFSESPLPPSLVRQEDVRPLIDFWLRYRDEDRTKIAAIVRHLETSRIECSDPSVNVIRTASDGTQILHLLDYAYDDATDTIASAKDVTITVAWGAPTAACSLLAPDRELELSADVADGRLVVEVPQVDPYAVLVLRAADA